MRLLLLEETTTVTMRNNFKSLWTRMLSGAWLVSIGFSMLGAAALHADTVFTDGTFNLANYSISTYQTGGATINVTQTQTGGDPGAALDIYTSVPAGVGESLNSRTYVVNKTFLYNPSTSGAVKSVGVSADVYRLYTGETTSFVGFSPVIYQDGNYYAYYTIVTSYAPGVYQQPSASLSPDQFDLITDVPTGAINGSIHPDLGSGGDPFQLGFSASLDSSFVSQAFTTDFRYDNLTFHLVTGTPEPSATAAIGLALVGLALGIKKRIGHRETSM